MEMGFFLFLIGILLHWIRLKLFGVETSFLALFSILCLFSNGRPFSPICPLEVLMTGMFHSLNLHCLLTEKSNFLFHSKYCDMNFQTLSLSFTIFLLRESLVSNMLVGIFTDIGAYKTFATDRIVMFLPVVSLKTSLF